MIFTIKNVRKLTNKVSQKEEKEMQKDIKSLIRTLKSDIKKTSKKGISDLRVKIRNSYTYNIAKRYFISKGFRCYEYLLDEYRYLVIEW